VTLYGRCKDFAGRGGGGRDKRLSGRSPTDTIGLCAVDEAAARPDHGCPWMRRFCPVFSDRHFALAFTVSSMGRQSDSTHRAQTTV